MSAPDLSQTRFPPSLEEHFQIEDRVHRGELSQIFRVRPRAPEDAPSVLLRHFPRCLRPRSQEELLQRIQHLASTQPEALPEIRGAGTTPDGAYVLLEEVEGALPTDPDCPLGPLEIARELVPILQGLHQAGHLHGDLRPGNLRIGADGKLRLLGSNLGLEPRRMDGGLPEPGDPPPEGYPQLLSPQLHFMKRAASEDDWFAWAVTVWYLIEGEVPFEAEELSRSARLQKLARVRPQRTPPTGPLGKALRGCLVLVPQDRSRTIAQLEALLGEASCPGRPEAYAEVPRLPLPERRRSSPEADKEVPTGPSKPGPGTWILVLLLGMGALLWLLSRAA